MNTKQSTHDGDGQGLQVDHGGRHDGAPMAPMVEYALTKDAGPNIGGPATSKEAAKITVALSDNTVLTIVRTSVDIKPDMCIWRGAVEGTGRAGRRIMWWPGGKMAGTVQHQGQHLFDPPPGRRDAMPSSRWARTGCRRSMRRCPSACAQRPNLRDDPLRNRATPASCGRRRDGMRPPQSRRPTSGQKKQQQRNRRRAKKAGRRPRTSSSTYRRLHQEGRGQLRRRQARAGRPLHRGGQQVVPHERPRPRQAAARARLSDRLRRGGRALRSRLALCRQGRRLHGGDPSACATSTAPTWRILIVDDPKGCGLATRVYADAEEAFAVVHHECAATSYTRRPRDRPPHRRAP